MEISLSACKDSQRAWEYGSGGSMTQVRDVSRTSHICGNSVSDIG